MNGANTDVAGRAREILLDLCSIKSVTGSDQENRAAERIYEILSGFRTFSEYPSSLKILDCGGKKSVFAYMACPGSPVTVGLTGHFDVVSQSVYRDLADLAFDPEALTLALASRSLPEPARTDLDAGWLFGRGAADMKCGLAVFLALMEKWDSHGLPCSVVFLAVPDEENLSCGMRGALPKTAEFLKQRGIKVSCWINGEPAFSGDGRTWPVYRGSVGKVMGFVLSVGVGSHGGEFFKGLSAVQIGGQINARLEGSPDSSDLAGGKPLPPAACVGFEPLRDGYSVTLFDRVMARYNILYWSRSPMDILEMLKNAAREGLAGTMDMTAWAARKLGQTLTLQKPRVLTWPELRALSGDFAPPDGSGSPVERACDAVTAALDKSGLEGPLAVVGFLPPWYPPSVPGNSDLDLKLDRAMRGLFASARKKGLDPVREDVFQGISDLSYLWPRGDRESLEFMAENMPVWNTLYRVPLEEAEAAHAPVCNLGPLGRDIHKATERLEPRFAFSVLPDLVERLVLELSQKP